MHTPIVFDGRNLFDPDTMRNLGFQYYRIGHPPTKANSIGLSNGNAVRIPITLESGTTPVQKSSNRPRPPYLVKPSVR